MLSFLAPRNFDAKVVGINELNDRYRAQYGAGDYTPIVGLTYWSFLAHRLGAGRSSLREHLAALTGAGVVRQRRR